MRSARPCPLSSALAAVSGSSRASTGLSSGARSRTSGSGPSSSEHQAPAFRPVGAVEGGQPAEQLPPGMPGGVALDRVAGAGQHGHPGGRGLVDQLGHQARLAGPGLALQDQHLDPGRPASPGGAVSRPRAPASRRRSASRPTSGTLATGSGPRPAPPASGRPGRYTGTGSARPLTRTGGRASKARAERAASAVAASQSTPSPASCISRAARFTGAPSMVYSRRQRLPTVPQKAWPVVTPTAARRPRRPGPRAWPGRPGRPGPGRPRGSGGGSPRAATRLVPFSSMLSLLMLPS